MREIKFRVWDPSVSEMVEFNTPFFESLMIGDWPAAFLTPDNELDSNLVWLQYTGLKDKNGVEIYEGDVIIDHDIDKNHLVVKIGSYLNDADKLYHYGVYNEVPKGDICYMGVKDIWGYEVIGNIYENPDYLK